MNLKAIAILLSIFFGGSCLALHAADQKLIDLLVEKGLLTQAEADTVSQQTPPATKTLVDLLVSKGHITQAEANVLGTPKVENAVDPASKASKVFVVPKSKTVTSLKFSGRIQAQYDNYDGVGSGESDREHFYFRRIFLGAHAKLSDHWGGDVVMDFADENAFLDGASAWYQANDALRIDAGQLKVPFGIEETTSSAKVKTIERSAVNRQFAETIKFNARHTGIFAKGKLENGLSYGLAYANAGQNNNSKASGFKDGAYGYEQEAQGWWGRLRYDGSNDSYGYFGGIEYGHMPMGGNYAGGDFTAYNLFGNLSFGKLNLEGEYMNGEAQISGARDQEHAGYMIQTSYDFDDSWELVYRFSNVNGEDDTVNAKEIIRRANVGDDTVDEMDQHYFGINYLFQGHDTKLMLGYEINELEDTSGDGGTDVDANGMRARLQILF
jgi:phosphate-selective porin OprO and OprP